MPPSPTINLVERATSSSSSKSSSTSYDCNGKDKDISACQKPVDETGLEVGLGVGIPVALILLVLSYFLYKNYRKDKKESLERDPDFDENGDSTALPDFPAFSKEDPFANGGSVNGAIGHNGGYPLMNFHNKSANDLRSMLTHGKEDGFVDGGYVDGFVLPYQHQTDSKASLDEYAKQIMDQSSHRATSMYSRSLAVQPGMRTSPQKSTLRQIDPAKTPVGKLLSSDYTKLNNNSTSLLATDYYQTKEKFDESDGTSGETTKTSGNHFDVEYENELNPVINMTMHHNNSPLKHTNGPDSDGVESVDTDDSDDDITRHVASKSLNHPDDTHDETAHTVPSFNVQSPFEDQDSQIAEESQIDSTADELQPPVQVRPVERTDGDFDFSNEDFEDKQLASADNSFGLGDGGKMRKSPRMSAFNMLKNVSDDEDGEVVMEEVNMTADQEEELARMKSVYKVYFDRANSVKSEHGGESSGRTFEADPAAPLPALDIDRLKINDQLRGDTNYDKRMTTTSSIYEENPLYGDSGNRIAIHPHQQFNAPPPSDVAMQQQYYGQSQHGAQNGYYAQQSPDPSLSPQNLPPLKSLPHPSDFRHSTIETFTDYQPRAKITSPSMKNQHNYFDPVVDSNSSPYMSSQGSFASPTSPDTRELPPTLRKVSGGSSNPSPSLLSRTSVVMLNPVSEITTLRKFKPAGSLPTGVRQAAPYYQQSSDDLVHSNDDLIPGNRKSAVRRMMNTNF